MLGPLTIGKKTFDNNLIQAPLAGVSAAPFRELVWEFGGVGYCVTEMLSSHQLASGIDRSPRYHTKFKSEGPLCWQLSGNDTDLLKRASENAVKHGADLLDLNCGCPQPKIRKKGCGSKLLTEEKKLATLVRAIKQDNELPVTVKIRVDAGRGDFCETKVANMLEQAGADAIIVHGRNWTQHYETACNFEFIAKVVDAVNIPVIGNGDLSDAASVKKMFADTGCAGFMIARASVGQPWLFQQITAELSGDTFTPPSARKVAELFLKHVNGLVKLDGEKLAVLQSRKLGKYYARNLSQKENFLNQLYIAQTLQQFEQALQFFC